MESMTSRLLLPVLAILLLVVVGGCTADSSQPDAAGTPAILEADHDDHDTHDGHADEITVEALPELTEVTLAEGEKLRVVATTNLIGDVVRQVAGDAIDMTQLLPAGADPHSYQARPDDMRKLSDAHVVFINGLHLEEAMQSVFDTLDGGATVVSVNAGITPLEFGGHDHEEEHEAEAEAEAHHHEGADPHTWMDPRNVEVWADNIATTLAALDPANAEQYAANAGAYKAQLAELNAEIATAFDVIAADQRKFVTDHDNLGYLANAYGFTVVGSVIPSLSTLAVPSAQELAALQTQIEQEGVKVIMVGTTVNPDVATQIAADTGAAVVPIYTDSLSDASGPAATYIDMMRYNVDQLLTALGD